MNNWTSFCLAFVLSCISMMADATPTISSIQLVNSIRISRTVYDYVYQATFRGDTTDYQSVSAKLTKVGKGSGIIDADVSIGALNANGNTTSGETFTIRHDRTYPFDANALTWQINGLEKGLIPGDPIQPAAAKMPDVTGLLQVKNSDYSVDATGSVTLRTGAIIGIRSDATVGEVNAFLKSHGAKIVEAIPGVSAFAVSISDPGSIEDLKHVLSTFEGDSSVDFALPVVISEDNAAQVDNGLPDQVTSPGDISYIAHHLAVGGAGVWNVRRAFFNTAQNDLVNIISDSFGMGAPFNGLYQLKEEKPFPFMGIASSLIVPGDLPIGHGYAVTAVIAARFDVQKTAGLFVPELSFIPRVGFIDISKTNMLIFEMARVLRYYSQTNRVVLNSSLSKDATIDPVAKAKHVLLWERLLYSADGGLVGSVTSPAVEKNIIHVTSSGNVNPDNGKIRGFFNASDNSVWNAYALSRQTKNSLVVENRDIEYTSTDHFSPATLDSTSIDGGNISAVGGGVSGDGIWSIIDNVGTISNELKNNGAIVGTSFSTPQVAALASLVWQIKPNWTSDHVVAHIKANASSEAKYSDGAPVISAYETLLALDTEPTSSGSASSEAPVRTALFDVNNDGSFEIEDVKLAAKALVDGNGKDLYDAGFDQAASRFDFNADGFLGGEHTKPFNHDMSVDSSGKATLQVGLELPEVVNRPELLLFSGDFIKDYQGAQSDLSSYFKLDENKATDADILCYAIASKLFDGDQSKAYDEASKLGLGCYDFAGDFSVAYDAVSGGATNSSRFDTVPYFYIRDGVAKLKGRVVPSISPLPGQDTQCSPPKDFVSSNGIILQLKLELPRPAVNIYETQIFNTPINLGCDGFLGIDPQQGSTFPVYKLKLYGQSSDQQPFVIDVVQSGRSVNNLPEINGNITINGQSYVMNGNSSVMGIGFDSVLRKSIAP